MLCIDWTAVGSIVAGFGVIASLMLGIREIKRARFSGAIEILMQLDARFETPEFRAARRRAAEFLIAGSREDDAHGRQAIADVLNFFETVAFMHRNNAIGTDMVWHTFASWLLPYWKAADSYVQRRIHEDPNSYRETANLFDAVLTIEKRELRSRSDESVLTKEAVDRFLKSEAELPRLPAESAAG